MGELILSPSETKRLFLHKGWPWDDSYYTARVQPLTQGSSDKQRKGFHWLLREWLKIEPNAAKNFETLKTEMLKIKFGVIRIRDDYGNVGFKPLRRTTQIWDEDAMGYRRKKLSKKLYTELIEETYYTASQDDIDLPDMLPEYLQELDRSFKRAG